VNKVIKYVLVAFLAVVLLTGAFSGGFVAGHFTQVSALSNLPFLAGSPFLKPLATPVGASDATPDSLKTLFAPFWETWTLVHQQYVDQPVDDTKLMQGAIRGMLASLGDPHTSYFDPKETELLNKAMQGQQEYEGIGAYVDTRGSFLKVVSPISQSPAEKAGIKSGDLFIAIDGESMKGINPSWPVKRCLGLPVVSSR